MEGTMENDLYGLHFLTLSEVADLMHVHKRTLLRMIRSTDFPAVKVGGQWRVSETHLVQWIENRESSCSATSPPVA
jgi:excisionase family DNA binding protein